MDSVPIEIIQLGLGFKDYSEMARNVGRVLNMRDKWGEIFDRANSELPEWVSAIAVRLPMAMGYDRDFFEEAGLNYAKGTPVHGCLSAATADYLVRHIDKLKSDFD